MLITPKGIKGERCLFLKQEKESARRSSTKLSGLERETSADTEIYTKVRMQYYCHLIYIT